MANNIFVIRNPDPNQITKITYYVADTDAGKPTSSLVAGDLCWAVNTGMLYVATSSIAWATIARADISTTFALGQIFNTQLAIANTGTGAFGYLSQNSITADRLWLLPNVSGRATVCGPSDATPDPGEMRLVDALAKTAAIASTNLTNSTPAGVYRVTYYLRCTTADVTAGTIQFNATYTDSVGATTDSSAVVALTSTANRAQGVITADLASGNITYSTTLTGITGTSQYKLRVRCEFLG